MGVSKARARLRSRWGRLDVEAAASAALFASSSVAVMAPALTEGGAQKPETLLSSLPAGGFLSAEQAAEVCQEREVLAKFVVSANVQPAKIDELCLEGVPKDVIRDVINSKYANGIEHLPASGSDLIALLSKETAAATSNSQMMNDQSMGEQPDSMGFLKTSVDVPLAQEDKLTTSAEVDAALGDVEQMMGSFEGEQNVEEILRVFKSMEETVSSGVQETVGPPGSMFPEEGFSSFEREFLNDVVIGLCQEQIAINDTAEQQRAQAISQQQEQTAQRQFEQERRCAFLVRRLRKLQAQLVGCHVAEENMGVLEVAHASAKKFFYQELQDMGSKSNVKNFPEISTNLNNFLHKIEKTSTAQSNSLNRQRSYCRYFGAGSRDNNLGAANRHQVFGTPKIKLDGEELESVVGPLDTQVRTIHENLDSDCTASSSGGESADEMQTFNNLHQQRLPISKRAAWRYAQDRASIASRWTWLQAQISDLEYKIRQQNDLQRQLRTAKGVVILDSAETVNGYSGVLPGSTIARYNSSSTSEELPASRTRPFVWSIYRKRKLLQLDRLHEVSKRAAKASSIRCDCDRTLPACALCTGRTDPTQPQEPLEQMSLQERIAFVDPGYHPVLSFHDEILHSTHLDAIMKSVEWQQKMLRGNIRMTRIKDKESNERRNKKLPEHRTKYTSRLKKTSTNVLAPSIKRKVSKGKRNRLSSDRLPHVVSGSKKKIPKQPASVEDDEEASALSSSSKHSSPVPSPLQHSTASSDKNPLKDKISMIHGRSRQNSYDIDNIVIPYSVAASTRLEKLQYKEILTPKWRLCEEPVKVDVKNGMHRPSQDSDYEDVSDETIALRHERSEKEENKRFMTFAKMPHHSRIRHSRRTDSRADSGANTPVFVSDPMSPHPSDFGGDITSPITSPPATPLQAHDTDSQQSQNLDKSSSLFRRRTNSSVRTGREETSTCPIEDDKEIVPYESRTFPLSEEVYNKMLEAMPDGHWQTSSASVCSREEDKVDDEAEMESHESDTTESAYCDAEGEDPNDPEWTVADDRDADKDRIRPTNKR